MITNSRQNWNVGSNVKVGFLTLKVRACILTPGDFLPDAYIVSNLAGTKIYSFVPYNGLTEISVLEAETMIESNRHVQEAATARRQADVSKKAQIDALFQDDDQLRTVVVGSGQEKIFKIDFSKVVERIARNATTDLA